MEQENAVNEYGNGAEWCRIMKLGEGYFSSVYLAHNRFPPLIAVKTVKDPESRFSVKDECKIMWELEGCPYITRSYGTESTLAEDGREVHNLLMEYCSGGTLHEKIRNSDGGKLPETEARYYATCIIRGLCHILDRGYVHCDITPSNIFLVPNESGKPEFRGKIGDFGLAKEESMAMTMRGADMYSSPETVLDGVQEGPCDIWGLGCVVLEMLTGRPPWDKEEDFVENRLGVNGEVPGIPSDISAEAQDFIRCCLVRDPQERWTGKMLLNHPFLLLDCYDEDDSNDRGENSER